MALLAAFERQRKRKPCYVCGELVPSGIYRSHTANCTAKVTDNDDDCSVVEVISAEEKKRRITIRNTDSEETDGFCKTVFGDDCTIDNGKVKLECDEDVTRISEIVSFGDGPIHSNTKVTRKRFEKFEVTEGSAKSLLVAFENSEKRVEADEAVSQSFLEDCEPSTSQQNSVENFSHSMEQIQDFLKGCKIELSTTVKLPSADETNFDGSDTSVRSPYYLVMFYRILKRVLCTNKPQNIYSTAEFWNEQIFIMKKFVDLSENAKLLFIRLFTRKRRWLIAEKISYLDIAKDLKPLFEELVLADLVETSEKRLLDLSEAMSLLYASSLKNVAKHFKVDANMGKNELRQRILRVATQKNVFGITLTKKVLQKVHEELGVCYRITEESSRLFYAVFTLYSPMDMSTSMLFDQPSVNLASQFLFTLLQLSADKLRFPACADPPLIRIYNDCNKLFRYIKAKELETEIAELTIRNKWEDIVNCARVARTSFQSSYIENREFYEACPSHLRRFTDLRVFVRCMSHGISALERMKKYHEAVECLENCLYNEEYAMFLTTHRGALWDRLALNLDAHLKNKQKAMEVIAAGLQDPILADKDRLLLQDRGEKILKKWKGPLGKLIPHRVDIKSRVLGKDLGEARMYRFMIERNGTTYECSVEEAALDHYITKKGYKEGVHAEGAVWHTLLGLLFYDIIFKHDIEDVWFSETQMNPADLNSRTFFATRRELFEFRFKEISDMKLNELYDQMNAIYDKYYGVTNSEISWDCFGSFEQIKRLVSCCPIEALCAVFRRILTDYRNCRSGFPDLTVWNDTEKKFAVVEVKGPGDKLSTKQRLWLSFFESQAVTAHVCHVAASNSRRLL